MHSVAFAQLVTMTIIAVVTSTSVPVARVYKGRVRTESIHSHVRVSLGLKDNVVISRLTIVRTTRVNMRARVTTSVVTTSVDVHPDIQVYGLKIVVNLN